MPPRSRRARHRHPRHKPAPVLYDTPEERSLRSSHHPISDQNHPGRRVTRCRTTPLPATPRSKAWPVRSPWHISSASACRVKHSPLRRASVVSPASHRRGGDESGFYELFACAAGVVGEGNACGFVAYCVWSARETAVPLDMAPSVAARGKIDRR
ncbi:hypothetical protein K461DRAFT_304835 [Myriangium duriaei CBS 260.36]|uniref:Uncharacterized protein n=1 Tax=Myriangium duriaei CBS 260.36 TaxID=1168546 RepID=A0A9P4J5Q3_9PEZI|nr:hypothetical protein K461DRAFT_304835 [Myriangium duriaei CBS 260.36]